MNRVLRTACGATVALALAGTGMAISASSASASTASIGPSKIGPHQWFTGLVNGRFQHAIVKVVCPVNSSVGRALPGQTVSVTSPPVIAATFGYTGTRARSIAGVVGPAAAVSEVLLFHRYNAPAEFPTNIPLPCGGKGVVIFAPVPGSHTAKASRVRVTYANVSS